MAMKNSVSKDFLSTLVDSINILKCRLSGVIMPNEISNPFQLEKFIFNLTVVRLYYFTFFFKF